MLDKTLRIAYFVAAISAAMCIFYAIAYFSLTVGVNAGNAIAALMTGG
jgi:hypothetical protein